VRALWSAGRQGAADSLVRRYDAARTPQASRARLHLEMAELSMASGGDTAARSHLLAVRRLTPDTTVERAAAARLTMLAVGGGETLDAIERALARAGGGQGTPLHRRLTDMSLLARMLAARPDPSGASLFLAAEVARDSLKAPVAASSLFRRVSSVHQDSPLAARALVAALALVPDSATVYRERLRTVHARSPYTVLLDGGVPVATLLRQDDEMLQSAWTSGLALWSDSLRKLHPNDGTPAPGRASPTLP
jgi:hypothetical protein